MAGKNGIAQRGSWGVLIIRCLIGDYARSSDLGRGAWSSGFRSLFQGYEGL